MPVLTEGIVGRKEIMVSPEHTARAMGSGTLDVFATPALIALMEATAMESVLPVLDAGQGTVGIAMDMQHTAATPVGMAVRCESRLVNVEGRKLVFEIAAFDDVEEIGRATHTRYIIEDGRFMARVEAKRKGV